MARRTSRENRRRHVDLRVGIEVVSCAPLEEPSTTVMMSRAAKSASSAAAPRLWRWLPNQRSQSSRTSASIVPHSCAIADCARLGQISKTSAFFGATRPEFRPQRPPTAPGCCVSASLAKNLARSSWSRAHNPRRMASFERNKIEIAWVLCPLRPQCAAIVVA